MIRKERCIRLLPIVVVVLFLIAWPFLADMSLLSLFNKILIFALLSMSLDFVMGFGGLWSFCQGAFFGIAAYTNAILITRLGIESFWISAPAGIVMAGIAAAVFGFIALRVSAIYFLILTFALGQLAYSFVLKWTSVTGGSDGMGNVPYPHLGFTISWSYTSYYYFSLIVCFFCFLLLHKITKSPFGLSIQGVRENELRMRLLGYNSWKFKYYTFIIGGLFAGAAGVLYVHYNGLITPAQVSITTSGLAWFIVIVGGAGTLWGSLIGSTIVALLQYYVSILTPERWPIIFGGCFIMSMMFLRGGVFPHLRSLWERVSCKL